MFFDIKTEWLFDLLSKTEFKLQLYFCFISCFDSLTSGLKPAPSRTFELLHAREIFKKKLFTQRWVTCLQLVLRTLSNTFNGVHNLLKLNAISRNVYIIYGASFYSFVFLEVMTLWWNPHSGYPRFILCLK